MGCDVHMYREVLVDGVWQCPDTLTPDEVGEPEYLEPFFSERNYQLFGVIADVRCESPSYVYPVRGVPSDVSTLVREEYERWSGDAHTPSWLNEHELTVLMGVAGVNGEVRATHDLRTILEGLASTDGETKRVVFWFDN